MISVTFRRPLAIGLALAWSLTAAMSAKSAAPSGRAANDFDDKPIVLKSALVVEDEAPLLLPVRQTEPQAPANKAAPPAAKNAPATNPPASSTATPTPVPVDALNMQPVPIDGQPLPFAGVPGQVGPPTVGPLGEGDRFPVYYRDRPVGNRASKAEIVSRNRSGEPDWYKEWRCTHYGYYPTQWRPWPNGWHEARNLPATPYVHPYDLKQPDPDWPDGKRPELPERLKSRTDREKGAGQKKSTDGQKGVDPQKRATDPIPAPPPLKGPPALDRKT